MGIAVALSGRFALLGRQVLAGLQCYVDAVNAAGGIRVLSGQAPRPLELTVADDESKMSCVRKHVTSLIENVGVDLLIGPYGSGLTQAAAQEAEQRRVVLWNHSGSADHLFERGYRWMVSLITPASAYLQGVLKALRACDPNAQRVVLLSAETPFATDIANGVSSFVERDANLVCEHVRFVSGATDFAPIVEAICANPPDWLLGVGRLEDDIALALQLCESRPAVKATALVGAGIEHFRTCLGTQTDGFLAPSQWHADASYDLDNGPSAAAFAQQYRAFNGEGPDYPAAQGYAAGLIAQRALELAGSSDQLALRAAARSLKCATFYGPFEIEPQSGRQLAHPMLVTQWRGGQRRLVWPPPLAQGALIYPSTL